MIGVELQKCNGEKKFLGQYEMVYLLISELVDQDGNTIAKQLYDECWRCYPDDGTRWDKVALTVEK